MILLLHPAREPFSQEQRSSLPAALLPGGLSQEPEAARSRQNLPERSRSSPKEPPVSFPSAKHIATTQQKQTKGEAGTGRPKGLPRPTAAAPVSIRSDTGRSGAALSRFPPRRLERGQRSNTRDKALGTQPPLPALRAEGPGP